MEVKEKVDEETGKVKRSENLIFPRYHQLDVIRKILADVRENGTAQNYLIQHSAGSGKTNSIAWLAHRLTKNRFSTTLSTPAASRKIERALGVSLGAQDGAAEVVHHGGRHADEVNPQIHRGQPDHIFRGGHPLQHLAADADGGSDDVRTKTH